MMMYTTALGRDVSPHETQTILEDAILSLLFNFRMHPQNPNNAPLKLSEIARAVSEDERLVIAALDTLRGDRPPLVEETEEFESERAFRLTGHGVRFVRNMPQGLASVL
jgi:hypothetical protein